jgi:TonB family protein
VTAALVALSILCATPGAYQPADRASLVAEDANYTFRDGVLDIKGGRGWLRIPRVFLNFRVGFDFKSVTPESDAGVIVRTWTGTNGWPFRGYRLRLPIDAASDAPTLFTARGQTVTVAQRGKTDLRPSNEWQTVDIVGEGRQITITLNGTLLGVFEIETFGGHILFENRKGLVQFRNITVVSTEPDNRMPDNVITFDDLEKAGGRAPKLIHEVKPNYTSEAMRKRVEGHVEMQVVVLPDGSVGAIRITRSLDSDLDLSAIAALREWRFKPAVLNGNNASVLVDVDMMFTLK